VWLKKAEEKSGFWKSISYWVSRFIINIFKGMNYKRSQSFDKVPLRPIKEEGLSSNTNTISVNKLISSNEPWSNLLNDNTEPQFIKSYFDSGLPCEAEDARSGATLRQQIFQQENPLTGSNSPLPLKQIDEDIEVSLGS